MSEQKINLSMKLTFDNWNLWDCHIKSTICRKNAYITFDPEPINPSTPALQQTKPAMTATATTSTTTTPVVMVTPNPTAEELKTYCEELKEWKTTNNVAAGVILGLISNEVKHIIDPKESARDMYVKLKNEVLNVAKVVVRWVDCVMSSKGNGE